MLTQIQKGGGNIVSTNSRRGSRRGGWLASRSGRFTSGKFGTCCTVGWMGFGTRAVGTEKSPLHRDSISRPVKSVPSRYTDCTILAAICRGYIRVYIGLEQSFPNCFARGPLLTSKNNHGSSHPVLMIGLQNSKFMS
jgi:hypothetical protein